MATIRKVILAHNRCGTMGGVTSVIEDLAEGFSERGYEVELLSLYRPLKEYSQYPMHVCLPDYLIDKTTHNRLVYRNPGPLGLALRTKQAFTLVYNSYHMVRTLKYFMGLDEHTAIVVMDVGAADYLLKTLPLVRRLTRSAPAMIYEFHSGYNSAYRISYEKILRLVAHGFDRFVVLSHADAKKFSELLGVEVTSINNPLKVSAVTAQKTKTIVYAGRYSEEKGLQKIVDAFARVSERYPQWSLEFYGVGNSGNIADTDGYLSDIPAEISHKIFFNDALDRNTLHQKLAGASLAMMASDFEGLPIVLLEAMASKTPMVSLPSSYAIKELVAEAGYLAEGMSTDDLTAALERALSNDAERERRAERGFEMSQEYSLERVITAWEQLFQSI